MQTDKMTNPQRGRIGERLVECYINDELIPLLKKNEGWTDIIYTQAWFKSSHSSDYPESIKKFEDEMEVRLLITNGFCPTSEFWEYFKKLTGSLSNIPDGFLIKMERTRKCRKVEEAIEEFDITSNAGLEDINGNPILKLPNKDTQLPVVKGKIEVVEVKTGRSCYTLQVPSYRNAVANGYHLRLFKVNLSSFEIREKLMVAPNEIISDCFKEMKIVGLTQ